MINIQFKSFEQKSIDSFISGKLLKSFHGAWTVL